MGPAAARRRASVELGDRSAQNAAYVNYDGVWF